MVTFSILTNLKVLNLLGCAHPKEFYTKMCLRVLGSKFFHDNFERFSFFSIALQSQIPFLITAQIVLHAAKIQDH